jgi:transcriptional regulator with XRE-family HTH domain
MIGKNSVWDMTKLNEIMADRGMRKKDLAKKLKTSAQLISYYFSDPPTIYKALRIAKALSTKKAPVSWREFIS